MDDQIGAREAASVLLLEQLVVERAASKALRQCVLEDVLDVVADQRDPLADQLAVAADAVDVGGEAKLSERAAAAAFLDVP